MVLLF